MKYTPVKGTSRRFFSTTFRFIPRV